MNAQRAMLLVTGGFALALTTTPASAQVDDRIVLNILRECAKIGDPTARLSCYDNNIRGAGATPRQSVPGSAPAPQAPAGAEVPSSGAQGFGSEDVRKPREAAQEVGRVDEIRARIADVRPRQPGVYLLTLEDGAQWLFSESVSRSYRVPRKGDTVEISRAAMDSFLMRFNNQESVRVERVR